MSRNRRCAARALGRSSRVVVRRRKLCGLDARAAWSLALAAAVAASACETRRDPDPAPTYESSVAALLAARCAGCHSGAEAPADYRVDGYVGAIRCLAGAPGEPAPPEGSRIARAMARADHRALVDESEREALVRWAAAGGPHGATAVHGPRFSDPSAPESHGARLRAERYRSMLDATSPEACGRCHDGTRSRPEGVRFAAPNAPACTSCHSEADGAFACGTCHGSGAQPHPPRDRCFHPDQRADDLHLSHVAGTSATQRPLECALCHPTPRPGAFDGAHGDGHVEVWLDSPRAGRAPSFDATTKRCAGTCHDRGGTNPRPSWSERAQGGCGTCHGAPPDGHYEGACSRCHGEARDDGRALAPRPKLHLNGKVDLGDGSGRCGACHGEGDDPRPTSGAHAAHASPKDAAPVPCATCHEVPDGARKHPEGGEARVVLSGLAVRGGRVARYNAATKTCADTYCHAGSGAAAPSPSWSERAPATCGSCHGTPPPAPHSASPTCSAATCHGGLVRETAQGGWAVTERGRAVHVDGRLDRGSAP